MIGFVSGVICAALLSVVTLIAMQTLYVPTELVHDGPNLNLSDHMIESNVGTEGGAD